MVLLVLYRLLKAKPVGHDIQLIYPHQNCSHIFNYFLTFLPQGRTAGELVPLRASASIMLKKSKISRHKRLSDVVNVLKNVDNTSRPKLTKMKAHDLFSFLPAITPKHSFFRCFYKVRTSPAESFEE